ncbi:MAG TPA: hypothetical protein VHD63_25730, partial [Ktedonobacteraceae bacterium]|nr:hypothetical protein [Ktedonobacteraceae bacterium]
MSSMYPSFGGAPARPCIRCGTPLTGSETQCSRCGTYNAPPQGQPFGMFPQQGAQGAGGTGNQGGGPNPSGQLWGGGQGQPVSPFQNGAWPGNQDASASAWGAGGQGNGWQPNQNNLFGGQGSPMQQ